MIHIDTFEKLFLALLSDIYAVENKIVESMPEIIKKAQSTELKEALQHHLKETKMQITRLDRVYKLLGEKPIAVDWIANIHSVFEKGSRFIADAIASPVTDAAIIAFCQRIEHFEIATYGTLKEYADVMDFEEIKDILNETLKEEDSADTILNKVAKGGFFKTGINVKATSGR